MKIREAVYFSKDSYRDKISQPDYSHAELAKNVYVKRRAIWGSGSSVATNVVMAHVTGGLTIVPVAWAARNISVAKQKLRLLEAEWRRRGQSKLPKRKRDKIVPIVMEIVKFFNIFYYGAEELADVVDSFPYVLLLS